MKFEWDEHKNKINVQKHEIDFRDGNITRIISARKATNKEKSTYLQRAKK